VTERFSFEVVDAVYYDELRPGYAPESIEWIVERGDLGAGSLVVDLAAGTGQLSRRLAPLGFDLVAVEPAANMRARLTERLPSLRVLDGTAEALPFDRVSVDAVVVGNAFHHFDRDEAFSELRRVLRPNGVLALFWAWPLEEEQRAIPGIGAIFDAVDRARTSTAIETAYRVWAEAPERAGGFDPFARREFDLVHELPSARLADLYATSSDIAAMPSAERHRLLREIASLARSLPKILQLPSRTVVDLCHRSIEDEGGTDRSLRMGQPQPSTRAVVEGTIPETS
jgi:SAM-dependent methyltransferase